MKKGEKKNSYTLTSTKELTSELASEGVRHPKFADQQATAGSRGSGGRLNQFYSAVEEVAVHLHGSTSHPTEGHPV